MREIEVPANIAVITATLAKIERDTRAREMREAREAHAAIKPRFVTARTAFKNAAIILVAFGCAAFILWTLVIAPLIDAIARVFGQ